MAKPPLPPSRTWTCRPSRAARSGRNPNCLAWSRLRTGCNTRSSVSMKTHRCPKAKSPPAVGVSLSGPVPIPPIRGRSRFPSTATAGVSNTPLSSTRPSKSRSMSSFTRCKPLNSATCSCSSRASPARKPTRRPLTTSQTGTSWSWTFGTASLVTLVATSRAASSSSKRSTSSGSWKGCLPQSRWLGPRLSSTGISVATFKSSSGASPEHTNPHPAASKARGGESSSSMNRFTFQFFSKLFLWLKYPISIYHTHF